MDKFELKNILINKYKFADNAYLDKYVDLIISNLNRPHEKYKTQRHHIIPIYYYYITQNISSRQSAEKIAKNDNDIIINLKQSDHVLAHIYLNYVLLDPHMQLKNFYALQRMLKPSYTEFNFDEKSMIEHMEEFQTLYETNRILASKFNKQKFENSPDD